MYVIYQYWAHNSTVGCKNNVTNGYVTGISKVKLIASGTREPLKMIGQCAHVVYIVQ